MKKITLNIPDKKIGFFKELVTQLGFEIAQEHEVEISEEHKHIVRNRIKESDRTPERLLKWSDVKDSFRFE